VPNPVETRPFPLRIWSVCVERYERNYGDPPEKIDLSRPAFQGHWNRHGLIGYQWFPVSGP